MLAAFQRLIMDVASGHLHDAGLVASGRQPTVAQSITADDKAANIANTQANPNQSYLSLYIDIKERAANQSPMGVCAGTETTRHYIKFHYSTLEHEMHCHDFPFGD